MDGGEFAQLLNPFGCASCRYQRKRCEQNCEYRKYFPISKFVEFKNARKLFGMVNIVRMLNSVEAEERSAMAESILEEGKLWVDDPANGAYGVVKNLQAEIDTSEKELDMANKLIQACKEGNLVLFDIIGFSFSDLPTMLSPDCNNNIHIPALGLDSVVVKTENSNNTHIASTTLDDVVVKAETNEDISALHCAKGIPIS